MPSRCAEYSEHVFYLSPVRSLAGYRPLATELRSYQLGPAGRALTPCQLDSLGVLPHYALNGRHRIPPPPLARWVRQANYVSPFPRGLREGISAAKEAKEQAREADELSNNPGRLAAGRRPTPEREGGGDNLGPEPDDAAGGGKRTIRPMASSMPTTMPICQPPPHSGVNGPAPEGEEHGRERAVPASTGPDTSKS